METSESPKQEQIPQVREKMILNKRLESIGWGLFLIMLGGLNFIPDNRVPEGFWPIGVGIILLGVNFARYMNGIRMSGFTTVLGVLSLLTGIGDLAGLDLPVFPILLIILGANLILKPWLDDMGLFGKAEQSD